LIGEFLWLNYVLAMNNLLRQWGYPICYVLFDYLLLPLYYFCHLVIKARCPLDAFIRRNHILGPTWVVEGWGVIVMLGICQTTTPACKCVLKKGLHSFKLAFMKIILKMVTNARTGLTEK
jgi:hypothetical protein